MGKLKLKTIYDKLKRIYLLRKFLRENKFDFIIDFRYRVNTIQELLISHFAYTTSAIYTVHSGIIKNYIPQNKFIAKLIYSKHQFVTVSKAIEMRIRQTLHIPVMTIYNPFDLDQITHLGNQFIPDENNYIVAVGRMNEKVKQFDKLIQAYNQSILPKQNIKLFYFFVHSSNSNNIVIFIRNKLIT